jgi:hypothetical protein
VALWWLEEEEEEEEEEEAEEEEEEEAEEEEEEEESRLFSTWGSVYLGYWVLIQQETIWCIAAVPI